MPRAVSSMVRARRLSTWPLPGPEARNTPATSPSASPTIRPQPKPPPLSSSSSAIGSTSLRIFEMSEVAPEAPGGDTHAIEGGGGPERRPFRGHGQPRGTDAGGAEGDVDPGRDVV